DVARIIGRGRTPIERIGHVRAVSVAPANAMVPPAELPAETRGNAVNERGPERAMAADARVKTEHRPVRREASRPARERAARNGQNAGRERERGGERNRLPAVHCFCSLPTEVGKTEIRSQKPEARSQKPEA